MTTNISKRRAAVFPLGHRSSKNKKVNLCFQRVNENTTRAGRGVRCLVLSRMILIRQYKDFTH